VHALPPYALRPAEFRFRAVAVLAGRLALGGDREIALAMLVAARLVVGATGASPLADVVRRHRAQGARTWFTTLALPAAARAACVRLADVSAGADRDAIANAFEAVLESTSGIFDASSRAELQELSRSLAPVPA
jgi:hypothetical protein